MKDNNYITIQGWMITKLKLKGNELIAYALIYGFSQDGESEYKGSLTYLSKVLQCSRPTAIKVLSSLVEKGLISKRYSENCRENRCYYRCIIDDEGSKETLPGVVKNFNRGSKETLPGGSKETLPYNTNIDNTKDNDRGNRAIPPPSRAEVEDYFEKNGYRREAGYWAWQYYNENNWRDQSGRKVKSWKQKMIAVWFKDDKKIKKKEKGMVY